MRFVKLSRGRRTIVDRPIRAGRGLSGLGQTSPCGSPPQIGPFENYQCCPPAGWVIYDDFENPDTICQQAGGTSPTAPTTTTSPASTSQLPDSPLERVVELQRRIDERRLAAEEARFEQQKKEIQLRSVLSQIKAVTTAEQARIASARATELARLEARRKAQEELERSERNKKLVMYGALALIGAKVLGAF